MRENLMINVLADCIYSSSYWCESIVPSFPRKKFPKPEYDCIEELWIDCLNRGGVLEITTNEGEAYEGETYYLNKKNLMDSIKKAKKEYGDPDEWDGEIADCILQYAIFGELVFG